MSQSVTTGLQSYAQTYGQRPSRGVVGMACLILAESALFVIFVVAYVFYIGKSLSGPTPKEVLHLPIIATICLLSSSLTMHHAGRKLHAGATGEATVWTGITALLGVIFLCFTAHEWYGLIADKGLTIRTNLFGTTFYSLVGLHATHVLIGLVMLGLLFFFGVTNRLHKVHHERFQVVSYYWHFVDAVWVVVFTVVYVVGR